MLSYKTQNGQAYCGDSLDLLNELDDESVNLIVTSPPFALQRKKEYGNEDQQNYVDWLCQFAKKAYSKITPDGSFVIDIGGAYEQGSPSYSLYQFKALIALVENCGYSFCQPFYWHNTSALPSPIEWVNKRKLRAKTSVNTIWWLSKTPFCKANVSNVLTPYSDRMKKLFDNPESFVREGAKRPSGHVMGMSSWTKNNGGAIPPNLLQFPNTESNSLYLRLCKAVGVKGHPARFPRQLPEFFINFLTEPGDTVLDIFAGSNTTGKTAEDLGRRWISFELSPEYVATSAFRFVETVENSDLIKNIYDQIKNGSFVDLTKYQESSLF